MHFIIGTILEVKKLNLYRNILRINFPPCKSVSSTNDALHSKQRDIMLTNISSLRDFNKIELNCYKYLVPMRLYKFKTLQDFAANGGELNP